MTARTSSAPGKCWRAQGRRDSRFGPLQPGCASGETADTEENLEQDDFSSNRHPALAYLVEHDLFRKPVSTFRDHALGAFSQRHSRHRQRAELSHTVALDRPQDVHQPLKLLRG